MSNANPLDESQPQANFWEELTKSLLTGAEEEEEAPPVLEPSIMEQMGDIGDIVQGFIATALGARAAALESGIDQDSADGLAVSTYGVLLNVWAQGVVAANG